MKIGNINKMGRTCSFEQLESRDLLTIEGFLPLPENFSSPLALAAVSFADRQKDGSLRLTGATLDGKPAQLTYDTNNQSGPYPEFIRIELPLPPDAVDAIISDSLANGWAAGFGRPQDSFDDSAVLWNDQGAQWLFDDLRVSSLFDLAPGGWGLGEDMGLSFLLTPAGEIKYIDDTFFFATGLLDPLPGQNTIEVYGMDYEGKPLLATVNNEGDLVSTQQLLPPPGVAENDFFAIIQCMCRSADGLNTPLAVVSDMGLVDRISLWNAASGEFITKLADVYLDGPCSGGIITVDDGRFLYVHGQHPANLLGVPANTLVSTSELLGITDPSIDVSLTAIATDSLTEFYATALFTDQTGESSEKLFFRIDDLPFKNKQLAYDVSNDGHISPLDALLVINLLNSKGPGLLDLGYKPTPPFVDVSGDGFVSPLDALLVINYLNKGYGRGEGEFSKTAVDGVTTANPKATRSPQQNASLSPESLPPVSIERADAPKSQSRQLFERQLRMIFERHLHGLRHKQDLLDDEQDP